MRSSVGAGHRAQDPDPGLEHELGRRHPGHERELRVPVLDRQQSPPLERVAAVGGAHDLLVGHVEARTAAIALLLDPREADLPEELERVAPPRVDARLRLGVAEPLAGAHRRPLESRADHGARLVELERPEEGAAIDVGQERDPILAQHRRVQRDAAVGGVQGLPAPAGLAVDRAVGTHEARDIRDRIVHEVPAVPALEVERLVEVLGSGGIDRDERQVAPVDRRGRGRGCRGLRLGEHLGRESVGHVELDAQVGERGGELALRGRRRDVRTASGHAPSLGGARN